MLLFRYFTLVALIKNITSLSNNYIGTNNNNIPKGGNEDDFMSIQGNGVCRVEVAKVEWDALQPWQRSPQSKSTGTAFVIDGERLSCRPDSGKNPRSPRMRTRGTCQEHRPREILTPAFQ